MEAFPLSFQAIYSLYLWWKGEITGEDCAKNIIDSCAEREGGIGGAMAGAAIGTYIYPGIGTVIGGFLGQLVGSGISRKLSDWLTQKFFYLSKEAALQNAYTFLGLEYGASNTQISSNFRRLARKYHPDKGGSYDDWYKIQVAMAVIKLSKGEI